VHRELEGWRSTHARGGDGVVHPDERVRAKTPVVRFALTGGQEADLVVTARP
jgi:hypothetical protein